MLQHILLKAFKLLLLSTLVVFLSVESVTTLPAFASIRQMEEAPGEFLYQSRQSLRDRSGSPWQVVLFKTVKPNTSPTLNLRLIGFPGASEVARSQPLKLTTNQGTALIGADVLGDQAPASNMGQYDLHPILTQLPKKESLELSIPLQRGQTADLVIPASVIQEWQKIAVAGL